MWKVCGFGAVAWLCDLHEVMGAERQNAGKRIAGGARARVRSLRATGESTAKKDLKTDLAGQAIKTRQTD
jgi:hypothetical protein